MIRSFKDRRTEKFFAGEHIKQFSGFKNAAERKLTMLDAAKDVKDLASPPPATCWKSWPGTGQGSTALELTSSGEFVLCGRMTDRTTWK